MSRRVLPFVLAGALAFAGCSGSSDGGPSAFFVGGTLSGLGQGKNVVLQNGGADDLTVAGNGPFAFATKVGQGGSYVVTVKTQPVGQSCTVSGGSGTVSADVTSVTVTCTTLTYAVGGALSGLPPSASIVLRNNGADDLTLTANAPFTFATRVASGATYAVAVATAPAGQTCTVERGTGTVGTADVTNVAVTCVPTLFSIGGTVSGLTAAGLVLHNTFENEDLTVASGATAFSFASRAGAGTAYEVTLKAEPADHTCTVANGSGVVAAADVSNVSIVCVRMFTVGGTIAGLPGSASIVLRNNGGDDLTRTTNGPFTFATRVASGQAYAVEVAAAPAGQTCTVTRGAGMVGSADVNDVAVACSATTYAIGGSVSGLGAAGLVLHNTFQDEDLTVPSGATRFSFVNRATTGTAYAVTVKTNPAGLTCAVASGGSGTVGSTDVGDITVSCSAALQAWTAPTGWGGVWQDGPTMVQHAHFDANGIISDKGPTFAMMGGPEPRPYALTGFPGGTRYAGGPFPQEAVNYRAAEASALDLSGDMLVCAIIKPARNRPFDSFESPIIAKGVGDGKNTVAGGGWVLMQMHDSWCFHYEYKDGAGNTHQFMADVPNQFADQDFQSRMVPPMPLPAGFKPDPSYVVLCGGRAGDLVVVAANAWDTTSAAAYDLNLTQDQTGRSPFPSPYTLDAASSAPAAIGGYHATSAALRAAINPPSPDAFTGVHRFDGLVLETGVWSEPATPDNLIAKMRAFLETTATPRGGTAVSGTYLRNREAGYADAGGKLHIASKHAPRIDREKGVLFGLQSWNRVSYWIDGNAEYRRASVFAAGENIDLWTRTPATGASAPTVIADPTVVRPGDNPHTPAQFVTIPAGAALSIDLDQVLPALPGTPNPTPLTHSRKTWDASGPIQGQLWIRPATLGELLVQKTAPQPGQGADCTVLGATARCESRTIPLGSMAAGEWRRVSLNGAFTADATVGNTGRTTNPGTLVLANAGVSPIAFHLWGVQLTQLGGGGDLGSYDPAELMYDWTASRTTRGEPADDTYYPIDVVRLPAVTSSTATTGFCLAADATMPAGLPWSAPFVASRTAVAWVDARVTRTARLYVNGDDGTSDAGRLCFAVNGASVCGGIPAAWSTDGRQHSMEACVSVGGIMKIYADGAQVAEFAAGVAPPDLLGGTVLVGNGETRPVAAQTAWHGYISRAVVCRNTGSPADCR